MVRSSFAGVASALISTMSAVKEPPKMAEKKETWQKVAENAKENLKSKDKTQSEKRRTYENGVKKNLFKRE